MPAERMKVGHSLSQRDNPPRKKDFVGDYKGKDFGTYMRGGMTYWQPPKFLIKKRGEKDLDYRMRLLGKTCPACGTYLKGEDLAEHSYIQDCPYVAHQGYDDLREVERAEKFAVETGGHYEYFEMERGIYVKVLTGPPAHESSFFIRKELDYPGKGVAGWLLKPGPGWQSGMVFTKVDPGWHHGWVDYTTGERAEDMPPRLVPPSPLYS